MNNNVKMKIKQTLHYSKEYLAFSLYDFVGRLSFLSVFLSCLLSSLCFSFSLEVFSFISKCFCEFWLSFWVWEGEKSQFHVKNSRLESQKTKKTKEKDNTNLETGVPKKGDDMEEWKLQHNLFKVLNKKMKNEDKRRKSWIIFNYLLENKRFKAETVLKFFYSI
jgi:hypothetical protein